MGVRATLHAGDERPECSNAPSVSKIDRIFPMAATTLADECALAGSRHKPLSSQRRANSPLSPPHRHANSLLSPQTQVNSPCSPQRHAGSPLSPHRQASLPVSVVANDSVSSSPYD